MTKTNKMTGLGKNRFVATPNIAPVIKRGNDNRTKSYTINGYPSSVFSKDKLK